MQGSEIADGVARKSEGIAQPSFPCAVRQGVSERRSGTCLRTLPSQRRAAGGDKQTFENIEAYGRERWLDELTQGLKSRTYQPQPVRRVYIPKPDGKQRPLGSLSSMLHGCSGVTGSRRLCLERTRIWSQSKKSQTGKPRLACISSYSEAGASGRLHAQRTQGRRLFSAGECANNAA